MTPYEGRSTQLVSLSSLALRAEAVFTSYQELMAERGIQVRVHDGQGLRFFPHQDEKRAHAVLSAIEDTIRVHREAMAENPSMSQSQLIWRMMRQHDIRPPDDLFERLSDDLVIEIYSREHVPLYQSMEIFRLCSYSLDEIFGRPWHDLFAHSDNVEQMSLEIFGQALRGEVTGFVNNPFPVHEVREKRTNQRYVHQIGPSFLCFMNGSDGQFAAFMNTFRPLSSWREADHAARVLVFPQAEQL